MKKIFIIFFVSFITLLTQSCNETEGFFNKSADSVGGDAKDGGGLLPIPPLEGDDDDKDDEEEDEKDGDDDGGGCDRDENANCPIKISSEKIKNGSLTLQSIACDDHKVAICHKKSSHHDKNRYELLIVDQAAASGHLDHANNGDFLIDCKKINPAHKFIIRKTVEDQCNCQK